MSVVLLADLGEQLEARAAVAVPVLHANLGEDTRHVLGANPTIEGSHCSITSARLPLIAGVLTCACA